MRYVAVLVLALAHASAAEPVSDARLRLAEQVFEATGGEARVTQTLQALLGVIDQAYEQFYQQLASDPAFATPERRSAFLARLETEKQNFRKSFNLVLSSQFSKIAIEVLVPIYAEIYTEEELKQLIAFYASPVGQKLVNTQAERLQRGTQELMARFGPIFQKSIQEALAQERTRLLATAQ